MYQVNMTGTLRKDEENMTICSNRPRNHEHRHVRSRYVIAAISPTNVQY